MSNYYLVLNGEFAYNKSTSDGYPFGAVKRLDLYDKGVLSTLYIVFGIKNIKEVNSDFLTVFFDSDRWHKGVAERAAEGARNHGLLNISAENFFDIDLYLPNEESEQAHIGAYFKQLDHLITLHQRTCNFFLLEHCAYCKINFMLAWEQRKFADMATRNSGMAVCSSNIPSVEYEDIVSGQGILNKDIREKSNIRSGIRFEPGDVLFGKLRPYLKNWILPNFSGVAVGDFWVLHPFETDSRYLYYLIQTPAFQTAANQSTGTKMPRSDWNLVSKAIFFSPKDITEQRKIGATLQSIDHLITLHQRE